MHPPTFEKITLSLIWTRGTVLDTQLSGFLKKYFLPFTYLQWEQCFGHPNHKKIFTPLLIPTGKAQMHTLFERKFLSFHLFAMGKGVFKSDWKNSSHLFPQSDHKLSGVLKNILPLTNSHREMAIVHPVLKNLFTYLEWENMFGNPKSKTGVKKDAYLSIIVKRSVKF